MTINYLNVCDEFKPFSITKYPPHQNNIMIEAYFDNFIRNKLSEIKKNYTYLPIYWTEYYIQRNFGKGDISKLQDFLNNLPKGNRYFTVVQNDDGIVNDLRDLDIVVFSSGGVGNIAIPLICDPLPKTNTSKDIKLSFIGSATHDIRKNIFNLYKNHKDYHIVDAGEKWVNTHDYADILSRSIFSLCPRGYGKTSYRLCESLQFSCIPIYVYDDPWIPFQNFIFWDELMIFVRKQDINSIPKIIDEYCENDLNEKRLKIQKIYNQYFTFEGCCSYILKTLDQL